MDMKGQIPLSHQFQDLKGDMSNKFLDAIIYYICNIFKI